MKLRNFLYYLNRRDTHLVPRINPFAKIFLVFTVIIISVLLTKNILALTDAEGGSGNMNIPLETTDIAKQYLDKQKAIDDGSNQEAWINESLISNTVSINKALAGDLTEKSFSAAGWVPGGLIGLTNNSIATLFNPPASGVEYIAHTINNFMGKPAYAQNGFGFEKLNGIMSLWKTLRNTVYTLISLFFIIVGIMIMLRIKTSPQTTVTIQTALPKIVTTLILVTFSYAIAGLLIDFSYVFEGIILTVLKNSENFYGALSQNVNSVPGLMNLNFLGFWDITFNNLIPQEIVAIMAGLVGAVGAIVMPGGPIGRIVVGLLAVTAVFAIIYIYVFIQVVKLFFGLAKCYINIILKIIIAPLEISLGVFPGSKVGFSSWIFQLIANIVVFPITIIFLVIATIIRKNISGTSGFFWSPGLINNGLVFSGLIGIASINLIAKIPQIVPEVIFKLKPSPIGKYASGTIGDSTLVKGLQRGAQDNIQMGAATVTGMGKAGWRQQQRGEGASKSRLSDMMIKLAKLGTNKRNNV